MRAIDTNALVRFLTNDHPAQSRRAKALLRDHSIWIPKTVLLETAWVLRSAYELESPRIARALEQLLGLANVHVEDSDSVRTALGWIHEGLELADALHLASRGRAESFFTFDAAFRRRAARVTGIPVESP